MSDMVCKRCGADESRIDGYCSIECQDLAEVEAQIPTEAERELLDAARKYNAVRADYDAAWSAWSENTDKAAYEDYQTLAPIMERARVALEDAIKAVGV